MKLHIASINEVSGARSARQTFYEMSLLDRTGRHRFEPEPEAADAVLFVDLHQQPDDPLCNRLMAHPLLKASGDRAFVYDERDFPVYTAPGIYVGAPAHWATRLPVVGGPYPTTEIAAPTASSREPDLLFSFRGGLTHPVRAKIFGLSHPRAVIERSELGGFHTEPADTSSVIASRDRFRELIERSKFVLCPRGHGLSSYRLYEVLAAGRVPVVISDAWLAPPRLPWADTVVRIGEQQIKHLPQVLDELEGSWPEFEQRVRTLSERLQPSQLWDHYASSVAELLQQPPSGLSLRARAPVYRRRLHARARRIRHAIR